VAFQNLLLNAGQAMQGAGTIVVALSQSGALARVDITDQGPGIPPEVREKLFTPFFTTKSRGTGLGLATARRIAESHGGQVEILQSGREGTSIRVTLPAAGQSPGLA
jgi:signal transduction histidine kinase